MKVLVTGGTGFTGGSLAKRLASEGYEVRALVRDPRRATGLTKLGITLAPGELRDPDSLKKATEGIDTVYHIAALFRPENVTRKDMWDINVYGVRDLLDASIRNKVKRFVHCSTVGVHGDVKNPPANEESPYNPGDYYQESKTEGEKIALQYMREKRIPITVFRPAPIYGPGDLRFLKLVKALNQRLFIMLGSGDVLFHMVYIDDLTGAIIKCGTMDEAIGKLFIFAGERATTLNDLVNEMKEALGTSPTRLNFPVLPVYYAGHACELLLKPFGINPPIYRRRVDFFRKTRSFDISKAKRELGYRPQYDLKSGIRKLVDWYREKGLV